MSSRGLVQIPRLPSTVPRSAMSPIGVQGVPIPTPIIPLQSGQVNPSQK